MKRSGATIIGVTLTVAALLFCAPALGVEARPTEFIGMSVVNDSGESLGIVSEMVFDARSGALRYFEVEHGGFLGLGDRPAAVAPGLLSLRNGTLLYGGAAGGLERTPPPRPVLWPNMRAGKLIHREVRDRRHRDSGEIVDLGVDLDKGRVTVAIVDLRDDWKHGRRLMHVPIEEFSLPRDMGRFATLNIDRERLLAESN